MSRAASTSRSQLSGSFSAVWTHTHVRIGPFENVPVCCHSENVPALSMNKLESGGRMFRSHAENQGDVCLGCTQKIRTVSKIRFMETLRHSEVFSRLDLVMIHETS